MMPNAPRICLTCQTSNPSQAVFCFGCGKALDQPAIPSELLHQRYHLLHKLGVGGFGSVYLAEDTRLGQRLVAVKEVSPQSSLSSQENREATEAFRQEALLLAELIHPNLPGIHDHFSEDGHWYLVMDFIEGETLETHLEQRPDGYLPLVEALEAGLQLCDVLDYLHTRQPPIIFRDLKPLNIMRTLAGHLYLIDFGIARHFKPGQAKDTIAFGSPGYAAPEQYGKTQTTPRSDIYSLGATLYQMLTGIDPSLSPFRFAPLRLPAGQATPRALAVLLEGMLEMDEIKRPSSITVVRTALQEIATRVNSGSFAIVKPVGLEAFDSFVAPAPVSIAYGTLRSQHQGLHQSVRALVWSPDGKCLASAGNSNVVDIWNPETGQTIRSDHAHRGGVRALAWSPDGHYIASASEDRTVQVWEVGSGKTLQIYKGHAHIITALCWSPDNHFIASASVDKRVHIWEVQTGQLYVDYNRHRDIIYSLAWSPNGKYIVSGDYDTRAQVWEAMSGKHLSTYSGHVSPIVALAWLPDNLRIVSGDNTANIQIWQALDGYLLTGYYGHTGQIYGLSCSPDGGQIVSGGNDGTAQIWDANTGFSIFTYQGHNQSVVKSPTGSSTSQGAWQINQQHKNTSQRVEVHAVSWSPDGQWIASGGDDGIMHVWQAR